MNSPITRVPLLAQRPSVVQGNGMTHRGLVRKVNEDAILTDPGGTLWAVADGMGGHGHGDVASDIVIDCLSNFQEGVDPAADLREALRRANLQMNTMAAERHLGHMGATVVAALIDRSMVHVAWVGDSRAYLLRGNRLRQLSHDHSVVQDLVDRGALRAEDAEMHPDAHIVTRAIGGDLDVVVDMVTVPMIAGDRIMLCSDGLTRPVREPQIAEILANARGTQNACQLLLLAALEGGAPDNVSVIVLDVCES